MASNQEVRTFPVKLWVDKEKNRVVVAESTGEFVDTLLRFLIYPLGNIIQLVSPTEIGCIKNLYQSVENIDAQNFWNRVCKNMLLHPRDAFGVSDTRFENSRLTWSTVQFFMCRNCGGANGWLLSRFAGTNCSTCGHLMNLTPRLVEKAEGDDENFVKFKARYLIFDDLHVKHSSSSNFIPLFLQLGYTDLNKLTEMSLNVGSKEMVDLLERSLISKSPLTEVFLKKGESKPMAFSCPRHEAAKTDSQNYKVKVKIITSKQKNTILYAEAEDDFIDFLFSFLTLPLASIPKLLNGISSLGCMDNLYQSVKNINSSCRAQFFYLILDPEVNSRFGAINQPLAIRERRPPKFWCSSGGVYINTNSGSIANAVISMSPSLIKNPVAMKLYEPRCGDDGKKREEAVGFVRRPAVFAVWDDLKMTPLTSASIILFLKKLDVPLDDLEEHVVGIGEIEALQLLRASLTSRAALTEGLFFLLKKPVGEEEIPPCLEAPIKREEEILPRLEAHIENETAIFCKLKKYTCAVYYMLFYSVVLKVRAWLRKGRD